MTATGQQQDSWHVVKTRLRSGERDDLEALAAKLDRSVASVLRLAVRHYLEARADNGGDPA